MYIYKYKYKCLYVSFFPPTPKFESLSKIKRFLLFKKLDCSTTSCKTCTLNICSECLSNYYLYEGRICSTLCSEIDG